MQDTPDPSRDGQEDSAPGMEILRPGNNPPLQLTNFVGRGREMAEVEALLSEHRLLTLTGPGGSGKTRLALAVASEVVDGFEDGVWLAELASLSDQDLVPQAVASVLEVREAPGRSIVEALGEHLEPRSVLLVLDNCEHLARRNAAAFVPEPARHRHEQGGARRRGRDALRHPSPLSA